MKFSEKSRHTTKTDEFLLKEQEIMIEITNRISKSSKFIPVADLLVQLRDVAYQRGREDRIVDDIEKQKALDNLVAEISSKVMPGG